MVLESLVDIIVLVVVVVVMMMLLLMRTLPLRLARMEGTLLCRPVAVVLCV